MRSLKVVVETESKRASGHQKTKLALRTYRPRLLCFVGASTRVFHAPAILFRTVPRIFVSYSTPSCG